VHDVPSWSKTKSRSNAAPGLRGLAGISPAASTAIEPSRRYLRGREEQFKSTPTMDEVVEEMFGLHRSMP
jgi:hypothetical protein